MRHACPNCGTAVTHAGRCTRCNAPENQRKNSRPTASVYQSPRWKQLRASILKRDHHTCTCGRPATTIHHIHPFVDGNDPAAWNPGNLRALCARCHGHKDGKRAGTAPGQPRRAA